MEVPFRRAGTLTGKVWTADLTAQLIVLKPYHENVLTDYTRLVTPTGLSFTTTFFMHILTSGGNEQKGREGLRGGRS